MMDKSKYWSCLNYLFFDLWLQISCCQAKVWMHVFVFSTQNRFRKNLSKVLMGTGTVYLSLFSSLIFFMNVFYREDIFPKLYISEYSMSGTSWNLCSQLSMKVHLDQQQKPCSDLEPHLLCRLMLGGVFGIEYWNTKLVNGSHLT